MKKLFLILLVFSFVIPAYAGSINPALYSTMQKQAYRNNYRNQTRYKTMPYWQAQSNYTTRNRVYSDYGSYNNQMNLMHQYNSGMYRGRY